MLNRLGCSLTIVWCVVAMGGCRREHSQDSRAAAAQHGGTAASQRSGSDRNTQQVSLTGCLEPAAPPGTYALRNIRLGARGENDPHRNTTSPGEQDGAAGEHAITEGSWVRVRGDEQLQAHAGRRVAVTGMVIDSGANTIGTAGADGRAILPSGDASEAAASEHHSTKVKKEAGRIARESMANGTVPEIRVTGIQDVGDRCEDKTIRR
jgi:hypothetical protein